MISRDAWLFLIGPAVHTCDKGGYVPFSANPICNRQKRKKRKMRWLFLTVSVLLACRASADGDSDVLDLTAANFADSTDTDIILVEFFAPW